MSLLMYRNRVLTADRRITLINIPEGCYDGLELHSKLYLTEDKKMLVGAVGNIPTHSVIDAFKAKLEHYYHGIGFEWMNQLKKTEESKEIFSSNTTLFVFFQGRFFVFSERRDIDSYCDECDLAYPRVAGSGGLSANVLLRSGQNFTSKQFYRIVSATTEGVGPTFDEISIDEVEGFRK